MYSGVISSQPTGRKLRQHRDNLSSAASRQAFNTKLFNQSLIKNKDKSIARRVFAYIREAWNGITSDEGKIY